MGYLKKWRGNCAPLPAPPPLIYTKTRNDLIQRSGEENDEEEGEAGGGGVITRMIKPNTYKRAVPFF